VEQGGLRQRLTAILAADVAGYTRLMAADAGATVAALEKARAVFREQIAAQGGRVVDMAGDSVLALFESTAGAVDAALGVQKALEAASQAIAADRRLRMRIGVHLGDIIEKSDGTIYGHDVNVAARLQAKAVPGGLCMSETLYESVKDKLAGGARFAGRQRLKNIDAPIAIWQIVPEGAAAAQHELDTTAHNLPLQLTSFIGREGELAEVAKLLEQSRLLTLLGTGGIGKSRLSLELAAQVMPQFADGVWLVELATLRDARLVPQAVASVLGVKEAAGRPVSEALIEHVKDRQLLLILDNCEHLLQGCAELARSLLQSGRAAKLVASSREPLRVAGETTYAVPALPQSEAERLFVERARAAKPGFRVNGAAAAVKERRYSARVALKEGDNEVLIAAVDRLGNAFAVYWQEQPCQSIFYPCSNDVAVRATAYNSAAGWGENETISENWESVSYLPRVAADQRGNSVVVWGSYDVIRVAERLAPPDASPPHLELAGVALNTTTNESDLKIVGQAEAWAVVTVAGQAANVSADGRFAAVVPLAIGANVITIRATDPSGNVATIEVHATRTNGSQQTPDQQAPTNTTAGGPPQTQPTNATTYPAFDIGGAGALGGLALGAGAAGAAAGAALWVRWRRLRPKGT